MLPAQDEPARQPGLGLPQPLPPGGRAGLLGLYETLVFRAQDTKLLLQQVGSARGDGQAVQQMLPAGPPGRSTDGGHRVHPRSAPCASSSAGGSMAS